MNRTPLTEDQFRLIVTPPDWRPVEIPLASWLQLPCVQRAYDTVAVMGSGCRFDQRVLHGVLAVAGADALVRERNRKRGEPEGNAYHYVFQRSGHPRFPYLVYGPFTSETRVPHWFSSDHLEAYWQ